MSKYLVIVESPHKAKTIVKFLGKDYTVMASKGHVRDLPEKGLGVNVNDGFAPRYVLSEDRRRDVEALIAEVKKSKPEIIYLASDPDREGEAIAWHLRTVLEPEAGNAAKFMRVKYNEITPRAVKAAFEKPGDIDMSLVNAQQARRILDRLVGFKVSRKVWQHVQRGLSAGRVQSVALRLLCEREQEIARFVPERYWVFGAKASKQSGDTTPFAMRLSRINGAKADVRDEAAAGRISEALRHCSLRVASVTPGTKQQNPLPPFITSSLQGAATTLFGFDPERTMTIAQRLYEGVDLGKGESVGLITYMRTDAPAISLDAQAAAKEFITERFGPEYYPARPNVYESKRSAQEAHEAIRPTDVALTPEAVADRLTDEQRKLYEMIWRRFVASQMAPARYRTLAVEAEAFADGAAAGYTFTASTSELEFEGFRKVVDGHAKLPTGADAAEDDESDAADALPALSAGEDLNVLEWLGQAKETKPPRHYSAASLIKALEDNGVGRPSTYASIIKTLVARRYIPGARGSLVPTQVGDRVNDFVVHNLSDFFSVDFTAKMEENLDLVAENRCDWQTMVAGFYSRLVESVDSIKPPAAAPAEVVASVFALADKISKWEPPRKIGKREWDERAFVEDIRKQVSAGERPVSLRQIGAVAKILLHYEDQIPGLVESLQTLGFGEVVAARDEQSAKRAETNERGRKLIEALAAVELSSEPVERRPRKGAKSGTADGAAASAGPEKSDRSFFESVRRQFQERGVLTAAQVGALARLVRRYADKIPNAAELAPPSPRSAR